MDAGNKSYNLSTAVAEFWGISSDEEIFDKADLERTARPAADAPVYDKETIPKSILPFQPDVAGSSPCSSLRPDSAPFNIELPDSFENSPSTSILNILRDEVNIPTPMPSPEHFSCEDDCNGEFCANHDQHGSFNRTPLSRKRFASNKNADNLKRKCVRNIARTFAQDHQRFTPLSDMSPATSVTRMPSSDDENDQVPVFAVVNESDESDKENNTADGTNEACIVPRLPSPSVSVFAVGNESDESDKENNTTDGTNEACMVPSSRVSVFAVVNESDESDKENNTADGTNEACMVPSPRGEKRWLKGRDKWLQNQRKRSKNLGLEYTTKGGKTMLEKEIKGPCDCRFKCYEKITDAERNAVFQKFWQLGDRQKQWTYLVKYVKKVPKTRCLNQDTPNNRKFTYKYHLPLVGISENLQVSIVDVCKTMFINTLAVSDRMIRTAWDKYDGSTELEEDKRGRHKNHRVVINESMIQGVVDHVKALAPVESHHLRKKTKKLYLEGAPTISRMFQLYKEWFDPEKYDTKAKTERQYREIVRDKFHLGRFIPKKDQCKTCHVFKNKKNPTDNEISSQNRHLENKTLAREKKEKDKKEAIESNGKILTAVFDFEKILVCPHAKVSLLYYKRKLACLNFTVFDMGTKKAVCYMWDETVAGRGSNEVSSCLLDYIDTHVQRGVEEFRFWSDNCTGQNRNRIVFFTYTYAANKYNINISHTFLEVGHTQNEGDSVHSTIERASSSKTIYTPEEWKLLVRWARAPDHEPYLVKNMTQDSFFDVKKQINGRLWLKNTQGEKISWTSVKEVSVTKSDPFRLKLKYNLNENDQSVVVRNRTRRQIVPIVLAKAYNDGPLPLSSAKYNDLISLCKQGVIPDEYVPFYEQLLPEENTIDIRTNPDPEPDPNFTDEYDSE